MRGLVSTRVRALSGDSNTQSKLRTTGTGELKISVPFQLHPVIQVSLRLKFPQKEAERNVKSSPYSGFRRSHPPLSPQPLPFMKLLFASESFQVVGEGDLPHTSPKAGITLES